MNINLEALETTFLPQDTCYTEQGGQLYIT